MSYHVLRQSFRGFGADGACVSVPWKNQLGGSFTGSLCPSGPTCGDVGALQQALTDLGFPCDVTGQWTGTTDLNALHNWRVANGLTGWQGPTAAECAKITEQWAAASSAPAPSSDASSPRLTLARRAVASRVAAPAAAARFVATPIKRTTGGVQKPQQDSTAQQTAEEAVDEVQQFAEETKGGVTEWWGGLNDTTKYAIIGGGVVVVGGIAYLFLT